MARQRIPLSECGLLSRDNARRYVGCLGDERFDREVGPFVKPRLIGKERYYRVAELDAWIDRDRPELYDDKTDFVEKLKRAFGDQRSASADVQRAGVSLPPRHG